jgi:hypothetical protein
MHGISKSKHEHLIDSLILMEKIFQQEMDMVKATGRKGRDFDSTIENYKDASIEAGHYRTELSEAFSSYNKKLHSLAVLIEKYDELFRHVKVEFVGKKLKDLKRNIDVDSQRFEQLRSNIQTAYDI